MHEFVKCKVGVLFKVVIILLISTLVVMGCEKKKLEVGFGYTFTPDEIMFGMRSDTDTFFKDDVTFDIYYGVHDIGHDKKHNTDPKSRYRKEGNETIFFGLYICSEAHCLDIMNDMEVSDYKEIDAYYFVKEISEEEAFTEEYGFRMSYWKGITYNHNEEITIPAEFFVEQKGSFVVKLIAFHEPVVEGDNYYVSTARHIEFDYEAIGENTIKIIRYKFA